VSIVVYAGVDQLKSVEATRIACLGGGESSLQEGREAAKGRLAVDDGVRRSTAKATRRVERVNAEELVHEAASDTHHGRAAVLTLDVELEGLDLRVIIAHPA